MNKQVLRSLRPYPQAKQGAKVVFAHDTELALQAAVALVNTAADDEDELVDVEDLERYLEEWQWSGSHRGDQTELDAVLALRPRVRQLWTLNEDDIASEVNAMLREGGALPQLVAHDGWGYHLHATAPDAPLTDRMLVEAAMAFVDVVRQEELDRMRICEADNCEGVLVDLSRNRARRYCSTRCANRVHAAAFRARQENER